MVSFVENLGHWKSVGVTHSNNPSVYSSYEVACESNGVKVAVGQVNQLQSWRVTAECFPFVNTSDSIPHQNGTNFTGWVRGMARRKQITGFFISREYAAYLIFSPGQLYPFSVQFLNCIQDCCRNILFQYPEGNWWFGLLILSHCSLYGSLVILTGVWFLKWHAWCPMSSPS